MATEVIELRITSYLLKELVTLGLGKKYPLNSNDQVVGVIQHRSGYVTLTLERPVLTSQETAHEPTTQTD